MNEVYELILRAQKGDEKAREQLLSENSGLIWACVKRFYGRDADKEDLYQIGAIGFLKGIDRFDLSYGVKLSTYIVPMIYGEIRRFLRDDGLIKASRSAKEMNIKIERIRQSYIAEHEEEPSVEYLAKRLNTDKEEIILAMSVGQRVESIYARLGDDDLYLIDKLCASNDEDERTVTRMDLIRTVTELDIKEQRLIIMRYFEDKTQVQAAKILGMSQVQVSRLEKKILAKIKTSLAVG